MNSNNNNSEFSPSLNDFSSSDGGNRDDDFSTSHQSDDDFSTSHQSDDDSDFDEFE
jgi:hypothetical protein